MMRDSTPLNYLIKGVYSKVLLTCSYLLSIKIALFDTSLVKPNHQ